jgi:hypothetical protein
MDITFENRRLYVAPRRSVLFFARVGNHRVRCYVEEDALIDPVRALREEPDIYLRCLLAFDAQKDVILATARRLLAAKGAQLDGALVVSRIALALEVEGPLPALEAAGATR